MTGPARNTRAEALARQVDACMTGGKLFTRQLMAQVAEELRRLDAENAPLREAQAAPEKAKPRGLPRIRKGGE